MQALTILTDAPAAPEPPRHRLPAWLKRSLPRGNENFYTHTLLRDLGLRHVVITSVTRDDLPDGGADHFARCVVAVRERTGAAVEVLTPDFLGDKKAIERVIAARPEVFNH